MKKIFLVWILLLNFVPLVQAQVLTPDDKTYIKKIRLIRSLERQIAVKQEEMRIAVSTVRTTFRADIQTLNLQIQQAETDLENL